MIALHHALNQTEDRPSNFNRGYPSLAVTILFSISPSSQLSYDVPAIFRTHFPLYCVNSSDLDNSVDRASTHSTSFV
jgi:hypothetical protein